MVRYVVGRLLQDVIIVGVVVGVVEVVVVVDVRVVPVCGQQRYAADDHDDAEDELDEDDDECASTHVHTSATAAFVHHFSRPQCTPKAIRPVRLGVNKGDRARSRQPPLANV
jgi:hypothetical protein